MKRKQLTTLDKLSKGQKATIKDIKTTGKLLQKLLDMGFIINTTIEVIRIAPLYDPIEVKLHNYHISLRKDEAKLIEIYF
ncbi:FeoA family protein [Arcobacter sp. LA11]|uniref:FeoA family protein n=1 Tax=Arcobacter sp. LA11 TaxID=1898176 RepID=UPI000933FBB4|nr:FeoA family protein [Arcobacter sp. LA11]